MLCRDIDFVSDPIPALPDVLILIGTQTGNSEAVADRVANVLADNGFICHLVDMAEAYPEILEDYHQLVVVMCTWAEGTFADNTVEFYDALTGVRPNLSALRFAMVGLGDHDYDPYFLTANHQLASTLRELRATEIARMFEIDGIPRNRQLADVENWTRQLVTAFATGNKGNQS